MERTQHPLSNVFRSIWKPRWPPRPLICWEIFDFSETFERNLTKLNRKQEHSILNPVYVFFGPIRKPNSRPASHCLRHFQLLLLNHLTELDETWQETRTQRPLPSLCFSDRSENQYGRLASEWLMHFGFSPLKPLNGIWRNLIGSKSTMSSTKFNIFCQQRLPLWPICQQRWHIVLVCTICGPFCPVFGIAC